MSIHVRPMIRAVLAALCLLMAHEASAQAAFVKPLLSGSSKASGTTLTLTGSVSVAFGNDIFVAFASDPGGAPYTVADNLGSLYTVEEVTRHSSIVEAVLFRAAAVAGGLLTTITVNSQAAVTAKAAVVGEFASVGTGARGYGGIGNGGLSWYLGFIERVPLPPSGVGIGAAAFEESGNVVVTPYPYGQRPIPPIVVGQAGTIGQGARSNVVVALLYTPAPIGGTSDYDGIVVSTGKPHGSAGASGTYAPK